MNTEMYTHEVGAFLLLPPKYIVRKIYGLRVVLVKV